MKECLHLFLRLNISLAQRPLPRLPLPPASTPSPPSLRSFQDSPFLLFLLSPCHPRRSAARTALRCSGTPQPTDLRPLSSFPSSSFSSSPSPSPLSSSVNPFPLLRLPLLLSFSLFPPRWSAARV